MQVNKFLKDEEYYSEQYDRGTIERCRALDDYDPEFYRQEAAKGQEQLTEEAKKHIHLDTAFNKCISDMGCYFTKGLRYSKKADTIRQWMKRDKELDDLLEATIEPEVYCTHCGQRMSCTSKHYHDFDSKKIVLMYDCPECHRARAFYNDGKEYESETRCSKCSGLCMVNHTREPQKIISIFTCTLCGNIENYELDLRPAPPKDPEKEQQKRKRFIAERDRYCFNEVEGHHYMDSMIALENVSKSLKAHQEKEANKELYDKVAEIRKLNVAGLKELLDKELAKNNYVQLELSQPEIGRITAISFSVQDAKPERSEYNSKITLQKLIKKTLDTTNWRLMSDGLYYRLGIIQGRLRGHEKEEELLSLIDPKLKNKKQS
ncbi:MAG: hypothetical protein WCP18_02130 [bacterium]